MGTRICNARQPNGVLRCDAPWGHSGDHEADDSGIRTIYWESARGERQARQQARTKVNGETAKQAYRQGRLAGIRDERLRVQADLYLRGNVHWAPTAEIATPPPGLNWCEACGEAERPERLQLHHFVHRSLGARATPEDSGDERPEDLGLICQGPGSCHDEAHPGPWN